MSENKMQMIAAPIPTEVPSPPNLDQLPMDILHSATVEMLIQQNEDLSSRLKVNIRRNSLLEQRILGLEKQSQKLEREKENLLAQNEIIKEKEKIWQDKQKEKDYKLKSLEQDTNLLERRYTELQTTSQYKQKEILARLDQQALQVEKLKKKLSLAHKIKERGKEKLRDFLIGTARGLSQEETKWKKGQSEQRLMAKDFQRLQDKLTHKENQFKEQLQKLKEASLFSLRDLKAQLQNSQELNSRLQEQLQEAREERNQLESQLLEEKKWRARSSQLSQQVAQVKNELIVQHRQSLEEREADAELISQLKLQLREQKYQNTELKARSQDLEKQVQTCEQNLLDISSDNSELSEQVEQLQQLWTQAQNRLEKEVARSEALAKINRELSQERKRDRQERAINKAQNHQTTTRNEDFPQPRDNSGSAEPAQAPIEDKINQVYASQYRALKRSPEMDV